MADCATIEEGIACANAGADFVGTTMRGYTPETQGCDDIDFDFIHELSEKCPARSSQRDISTIRSRQRRHWRQELLHW